MTTGLSSTTASAMLTAQFATGGVFVELHTADPGAAGTTSVSVGSTSRVSATMSNSGATQSMTSMASSWTNGGTSETLTHIALWSASTSGTFKGSSALTASKAWASGDSFSLTSLSISLTPIAA